MDDFENTLTKDPIPLLHRKGGLIFGVIAFVLVVLGVGVGIWNEQAGEKREQEKRVQARQEHVKYVSLWIASPRLGDVYSADLSLVSHAYNVTPSYGEMKLISIDGDNEKFMIAKTAYQRMEDLNSDISGGKIQADSYYDTDDTVELTTQRLRTLASNGTIYDVHR